MSNFKVKTPHAAVLIWNYDDRIGTPPEGSAYDATGIKSATGMNTAPLIVSTLSCVSMQTSKSKSQPDGSFQLVLAPSKNWTSAITAGSWCVLLMGDSPITEEDTRRANKDKVKMLGRIESVRCDTSVNEDGSRQTLYYVTGIDWGHIFNSILYVDNLIASPDEGAAQNNNIALILQNSLFGENGPSSMEVRENLKAILNVMGSKAVDEVYEDEINRASKAVYEFELPSKVIEYFNFCNSSNEPLKETVLNKLITLKTGSLTGKDQYNDASEALGFLDSFSLQGTHSLWQVLLENSNPALNEMVTEMRWNDDNSLQLALYNRIRPFCYKGFNPEAGTSNNLKSFFQYVRTHVIDPVEVISINAGTNWRDKFNFIEVKPSFSEFQIHANQVKTKTQVFDRDAFKREGFRPLIFDTKQFPNGADNAALKDVIGINWDQVESWTNLLREWYFGTHRLLNGTLVMHGSSEYIAVGNNIRFDAGLINPNPNINAATKALGQNQSILAHVESIAHAFSVNADGSRSYRTTIQFVRGIIVKDNNEMVGEGMLDQDVTTMNNPDYENTQNIVSINDRSNIKNGGT